MFQPYFSFSILFLFAASLASADVIAYQIRVNTTSISAIDGSLDFQFDPGPLVFQSASLQISNFVSDGTLAGSPALTGDVSGSLPATLTFDNGSGFNDYFEEFMFGTILAFNVRLYGPALSSPDDVSNSASTFAFGMFTDAVGTIPALTTDTTDGFAFTVDVNLDGTTTIVNSSGQTTISTLMSPVPEPAGLPFLATAMVPIFLLLRFATRVYLTRDTS